MFIVGVVLHTTQGVYTSCLFYLLRWAWSSNVIVGIAELEKARIITI